MPAFRKRQAEARAPRAAISASALRPSPSAPATARPAFAARGMEITPGWETVDLTIDPSGFVEARIGASPHGQGLRTTLAQIIADELGVDARRDQGRAWRHRPHALRLGHLRQPLAGDFRRRHADRGAQGARQADQDRQPPAGSGAGRHRAGRTARPRSPAPTARIPIAKMAREAYHADASLQRRDRAGPDRERHLRSARHLLQRLPCRHRRGRCRDRRRHDRAIPGGGGCRPDHQSDDRRRPGAWRRRAGHRQRAAGRDRLRRERRHSHRHARRLPAADRARDSADRDASHRDAERRNRSPRPRASAKAAAIGAPAAIVNAINDALSPFGVAIDEMPATPQRIRAALARESRGKRHEPTRPTSRSPSTAAHTPSRSSRAARWSTRSARIAARPAPISAASTASAAPAPCSSTASRCAPA